MLDGSEQRAHPEVEAGLVWCQLRRVNAATERRQRTNLSVSLSVAISKANLSALDVSAMRTTLDAVSVMVFSGCAACRGWWM